MDGEVDGKLLLEAACVTIGPNGRVTADVVAREVIVCGCVEGAVNGHERVQVRSTGQVLGEVHTRTLVVEEGAVLRGKVDAGQRAEMVREAIVAVSAEAEEKAGAPAVSAIPAVN